MAETFEPRRANVSLSSDGRWLAYTGVETGRNEVYVQLLPPAGSKYPVTTTGGVSPLWSPDGKRLYYLDEGWRTMAADVQTQPNFLLGKSTLLPIPIGNG